MTRPKTLLQLSAALLCGLCTLSAADRPNVVIIYGDDVGFGDVGVNGSKLIPTPNIDRLASGGLNFTDGHCSAATCTPSRFSLLTGVHGFRHDVSILPPNAPLSIPTEILTLPKLFKKAGYTTGVVGKWHLGIGEKGVPTNWNGAVKPGPLEIGFDSSFLLPSTNDRVPCVYLDGHHVVGLDPNDPLYVGNKLKDVQKPGSTQYPDGQTDREAMTYYQSTHGHSDSVINGIGRIGYMAGGKSALWNDETMADVFVKEARDYITTNKDKPFFLYFASQDIHVPRAPNPRFKGKTELGFRGDAMVQFDWATGEIMKALEENGLTENTIVIFSSDNGPVYDDGYNDGTRVKTSSKEVDQGHDGSGIWRGGKYQIYEGGTRVPLIIRWPARIKPGTSKAMVNQIDFIASFANMLDIELAENEAQDSRDMLPAFLGEDEKGLPYMVQEARTFALRSGDWKYISNESLKKETKGKKAPKPELYNLETDPSEQSNIIDQNPEKAASMAKQLDELIESDGVRK
ncbi:sulfatase-like hydrolase/transferase [Haloferula chungangensis]|uniref:Sulfatase-like hydrolase/transferase n=1 Tax=Haloferula chungangensis TaxID=1048331 RepID=A0ABW2L4K9_9BACT